MSSSEFTFKLFTGIIHDRAGETLVTIIRGEARGGSIVRSIFLDGGVQDFVSSWNRKAAKESMFEPAFK